MELFALMDTCHHAHVIDAQHIILEVVQELKRNNDL